MGPGAALGSVPQRVARGAVRRGSVSQQSLESAAEDGGLKVGVPRPGDGVPELPPREPALGTPPTLAALPGAAERRSPSAHSRGTTVLGRPPATGTQPNWKKRLLETEGGTPGDSNRNGRNLAQGLSNLQQRAAGET